jgi:hypothetical protein
MDRETYLNYRNIRSIIPMYEYYKEHFNEIKYKPFLNINEFIHFTSIWPGTQEAYSMVTNYYDSKFSIIKIPDKNGNYYKFL